MMKFEISALACMHACRKEMQDKGLELCSSSMLCYTLAVFCLYIEYHVKRKSS